MPVPAPNLNPDFNVVRLSHVEYNVRDLVASRAFYVDTLGLQITHETEDAIYLRAMEERGHHCIHLIKSDAASVGVLGFKVWDDADLDRLSDFFTERRLPFEWIGQLLRQEICILIMMPIDNGVIESDSKPFFPAGINDLFH